MLHKAVMQTRYSKGLIRVLISQMLTIEFMMHGQCNMTYDIDRKTKLFVKLLIVLLY